MKGGKRAQDRPPVSLDGQNPLVVPVMSAAGGVGRSTVATQIAVALHQRTADRKNRAVAVFDCRPRCASPWPGWLDHTAEHGTSWLAASTGERFSAELRRSISAIDMADGKPLWVLTDTGPLTPSFAGADPGPAAWEPVLRYVRAAVIDADPLEGFRLARQQAGGRLIAGWLGRGGRAYA
jgi:Mrp family chromosome partitioning ATPase